jgi:copper(I)-binding protein
MLNKVILIVTTLIAVSAFAFAPAAADDVKVGSLQISAPWARATPKGAAVGGGYLKITNTGTTADRLLGGSTSIAGRLEVHEMSMSGNTMKMRQLSDGVEIKPGQSVELKPGGLHIMFVNLKQQLQQGQHFTATLQFEKAGKVDVDFSIAGIAATSAGGAGQGGMHGMSHDGMKMK